MADHSQKGDLKLLGEIDARFGKMQPPGKALAATAIENCVPADEIELVRQIVERRAALTAEGRQYADKKLGVDAPAGS